MEKRVRFRSTWLPWALLAPQLAVIGIFFFWPAAQALLQSVQIQDAFGATREFVGLENFRRLFADETYIDSFKTTAIFSVLVAGFGISIALVLAVFADRVLRGAAVYKTLLVWPYAVAPAVAGVLWLFMFAPSIGIVPYALRLIGYEWNHLLNADHAMALIVMAAVWKQISYNFLFFLAGLQANTQVVDRSRRDRRRRTMATLLDDRVSAAVAGDVFSAGDQHRLCVFRNVRDHRCIDAGRAGQRNRDPRLQGVLRRFQGAGPRQLCGTVGRADGNRHRADGRAVSLR